MLNSYNKILSLIFTLFIINSSFLIPNCFCQWVPDTNGIGNQQVKSIAGGGNYLFAGTVLNGVYASADTGAHWTQTSLNNQYVSALLVNGNNVYAGTLVTGVHVSTNNGANWTQSSLNNQSVYSLAVNGNYVFAGTYLNGVYVSTDNGTTWTQTPLNNQAVYALTVNLNILFAGTGNLHGVYQSTNNGANWTQTTLNNRDVYSFTTNGNNLFAGTGYNNGVYKSTDNGVSWFQTSLNNRVVYGLASTNGSVSGDASDPPGNSIAAGTYQNGVYVSNDNGGTFTQRNEGLGAINSIGLAISSGWFFVVTDFGPWRRPLSELIGIQPISNEVPQSYSLSQNYPNPFNPTTKFKIQISKLSDTRVAVYDELGREIATLVNKKLQPGTYEVNWNAANYPSGAYFYKIISHPSGSSTGGFAETKKMVLIK